MSNDVTDIALNRISNHAIGLVREGNKIGSKVLGSGVLVSIGGRRGILTAGHVAEEYKKLPEIGLINFLSSKDQKYKMNLRDTDTIIMESKGGWSKKEGFDLAFTFLPHDIASSIEARNLFLDLELNRSKIEAIISAKGHCEYGILGMVAEFSKEPSVVGKAVISRMRGVLYTGSITDQTNGLLRLTLSENDLVELPKSFGGMSGAGLWRIDFVEGKNGPEIAQINLCGVVSWEIDSRNIACQGWDRIDQGLIPAISDKQRI